MARSDAAALAPNWRTIIVVDALLGVAALVGGAALVWTGRAVLGTLLAVAGAAYLTGIARRYRRWKGVRAGAGLT